MILPLTPVSREPKRSPQNNKNNKGIILIVTLWMLLILSLLSLGFAYRTRIALAIAGSQKEELNGLYLAKAVINRAIIALENDRNDFDSLNEPWHAHKPFLDEGWFSGEVMPKTDVSYTVVDEESKLNINTAESELLFGLFSQMTSESAARSLADCVLDWRDADSTPRPEGAEDEYYLTLSPPYSAKNGPFDQVAELLAVKGMTPALFYGEDTAGITKGIREKITVYGDGKINLNTASKEVIGSLPGILPSTAEALIKYRAGADGVEGTEDDQPFTKIEDLMSVPGLTEYEYYQLEYFGCLKSNYFTITAVVAIGSLRKEVAAVVDRTVKPVKILIWREN